MARPQRFLCLHCEGRLTMGDAFCDTCGYPTIWAAHQDRVRWEVQQWRKMQSSPTVKPAPAVVGTAVRRPEPAHPTPKIERKDWSNQVGWRKAMAASRTQENVVEQDPTPSEPPTNGKTHLSNGNGHAPERSIASTPEPLGVAEPTQTDVPAGHDLTASIAAETAALVADPEIAPAAATATDTAAEAPPSSSTASTAAATKRPQTKKPKRSARAPAPTAGERASVFATLASIPTPPAPATIKPDANDLRDERILAQIRSLHQRMQAAEVRIAALEARPISQGFFARLRARPAPNG